MQPTHSEAPGTTSPAGRFHRPTRWVKLAFLCIASGFLGWAIWSSRGPLLDLFSTADESNLALALAFGVAAHAFAPVCSVAALAVAGTGYGYRHALKIHLRNLPARYVPGGIWHTVGRAHDFLEGGMRKSGLTALLLLESAMPVGVGLSASCTIMLATGEFVAEQRIFLIAGLAIGSILLALLPLIIRKISSVSIDRTMITRYFLLIGVYFAAWILLAGMFISYLHAFDSLETSASVMDLGATYVFAWSVGFIAVFAPQGIGVFEVTAASFLRAGLDLTAVIGLVAGFRLIPVVTDLAAWGTYTAIRVLRK